MAFLDIGTRSPGIVTELALISTMLLIVRFGTCTNCSSNVPAEEVAALGEVAKELGKPDWNCTEDPCDEDKCWYSEVNPNRNSYVNQVSCECIAGTWHVSNISWKGQNLTGVLPRSLAKLPYIKTIDLSRSILTGTIPREWTATKLEFVSVFANRLSGPIPTYLGNMTTLTYLSIESNQFNGTVPAELGNLVNLMNLTLSDNKLTGQLPTQLKNLKNLKELRLSSNNFSGRFPDYFQNWTSLQALEIQGSGFEGPIPSSISLLIDMFELRITDLLGEGSQFPPLQNLTQLTGLVLRSCNLTGVIPDYLGDMPQLSHLDLSFNQLTGNIPDSLSVLYFLRKIYLMSNMLSGPISSWIFQTDDSSHIDLSYNDFDDNSIPSQCNRETLNLYRSNGREKNLDSMPCLRSFKCSKVRYSLHINCGGLETKVGKTTFEQDSENEGPAKFVPQVAEWGYSSSGEFWNPRLTTNNFIARNNSMLRMNDTKLYTEARLSATSLTYYGRCLAQGNYTVTLYFSEIVFVDDNTYFSLGRRMFDIYIQEKLVAKDFDIEKESNGTDKSLNKTFQHIPVKNSIEIRFYYAGKGSSQLPVRGNYGPLISAISVESEFDPPFNWKMIVWILIGVTLFLLTFSLAIVWWKRRVADIASRERDQLNLDPLVGVFTYRQIKVACGKFSAANKIGEGGFGSVYKGTLSDGSLIAVKQLVTRSSQGNREFVNEIGIISTLQHPNLVKFCGCCVHKSKLFLVYEYMVNNDLGRALFGSNDNGLQLDWATRKRICVGIARGLAFLHEESALKIVHRDIKATNVLLDQDLNPKIADFGLARLHEEEKSHISTRVAGTIGYMAPEYAMRGYLTHKADVYSFGVVILEIVAGRSNMKFQPNEDHFCLLDWAFVLQKEGNLMELVDPRLKTNYNQEEASMIIKVALLCINPTPSLRPTMSEAFSMLEGKTEVQEPSIDPNISYGHEWMYRLSQRWQDWAIGSETQSLIHSLDAPKDYSSSKSLHDPSPIDA